VTLSLVKKGVSYTKLEREFGKTGLKVVWDKD
jgi:hypothetical protein